MVRDKEVYEAEKREHLHKQKIYNRFKRSILDRCENGAYRSVKLQLDYLRANQDKVQDAPTELGHKLSIQAMDEAITEFLYRQANA
jgi:hypothetical protein